VYPISGDPDEEYPEVPPWPYDDRCWWSEGISAQITFFDRQNDLLNIVERLAGEGDRSLPHVLRLN